MKPALCLCLSLVLSFGCSGDAKDKDKKPAATKEKDDKTPAADKAKDDKDKPAARKPIPGAISAEALLKEFFADGAAAGKKYGNKEITLEGVVLKTTEDFPNTTLTLKGAKDKDGDDIVVFCAFPATERAKVEKVKVGETVGVKGKCDGQIFQFGKKLEVTLCQLVTD